jgi:hypothetical protein
VALTGSLASWLVALLPVLSGAGLGASVALFLGGAALVALLAYLAVLLRLNLQRRV